MCIEMVWAYEKMNEYRMSRRVLMAKVSGGGTRETEVRLDGWCEGGQGNRGMTVETDNARKIGKSAEPWYICKKR